MLRYNSRMAKAARTLLMMTFLLATCAAGAEPCKAEKPEAEVYLAVFKATHHRAVISAVPQSVPTSIFDLSNHQLRREWGPPKNSFVISVASMQEIKKDYERKVATRCSIPSFEQPEIIVVSEHELRSVQEISGEKDLRKRMDLYEERFRKRFGADAEAYRVSRVAFDQSHKVAVVHVSSDAGGLLYILRLVDGNWSIDHMYQTWAT
jgi:hypothetical protein